MLHRVMQESSRLHHVSPPSLVPQRPPLGSYTGIQWEGKGQMWVTEQILGAIFGILPTFYGGTPRMSLCEMEMHFRSVPKVKQGGALYRTNQILPNDLWGSDKAFYVYKPSGLQSLLPSSFPSFPPFIICL